MALLPSNFNVDDHEDMAKFEAYPAAKYNMKVIDSDVRLTKAAKEAMEDEGIKRAEAEKIGLGALIEFEIMDGKFKGKKYKNWYNLKNKSAQAEELGNKEFATLCRAIGITPKETEELHGKPLVVELKVTGSDDDKYGKQNSVAMYYAYDGPMEAAASSEGETKKKGW